MKLNPIYWMIPMISLLGLVATGEVRAHDVADALEYPISDPFTCLLGSPFKADIGYPETIRTLARKWSSIFEIPSSWIVSQAYAESRFHPLAENPSGATGTLQIKIARAKDLVKWMQSSKWWGYSMVQETLSHYWHGLRTDLLEPDLNIMLAAFDLHHLSRRFGMDHDLVAAAYNQGEGAIARWRQRRELDKSLPLPPRASAYIACVRRAKRRGYV
jgi:soluble lytic murein transglycosylase-like protein